MSLSYPAVIIDRNVKSENVDMVLLDNVTAGYRLAVHLLENGYKRIAAIVGKASTTGRQRLEGYKNALQEFGLTIDHDLIKAVPPKVEDGKQAALEILRRSEKPDAIFTTNSLLTAGAMMAIQESGLRIPGDVALVGFDDTTWSALVQPPITLIAQPTEEIGRTAAELLFKRIEQPDLAAREVILKGQLLVRGSSFSQDK